MNTETKPTVLPWHKTAAKEIERNESSGCWNTVSELLGQTAAIIALHDTRSTEIARLQAELDQLRAEMERLKTENRGMLNAGGYDYLCQQRDEAERRAAQYLATGKAIRAQLAKQTGGVK